jgi:hypothetical protein
MAQPNVPLIRRRVVYAKAESTYGADIFGGSVVAGDALHARVDRAPARPNIAEFEALGPSPGTLGTRPSVILMDMLDQDLEMPIRGAGAEYSASVLPEVDRVLKMIGHARTDDFVAPTSVIYAPRSTGFESHTYYTIQEFGQAYEVVGAFATGRMTFARGQPGIAACSLRGKFEAQSDLAVVTPSIATTPQYPKFADAALTLNAVAIRIQQLVFDLGVVLAPRTFQNDAKTVEGVFIAGRNPIVTLDAEITTKAAFDWFGLMEAGTLMNLTWRLGTVALNKMTITAPKAQIIGITEGERDGARVLNVTLALRENAGNDEYTITFD